MGDRLLLSYHAVCKRSVGLVINHNVRMVVSAVEIISHIDVLFQLKLRFK